MDKIEKSWDEIDGSTDGQNKEEIQIELVRELV